MAFHLFNTMSRKKELFVPLHEGKVGMYTCGPTVYNVPHIGNYRAYVFSDILTRYLAFKGFKVNKVMNTTDVDDKTIRDSQKNHEPLLEFTKRYTDLFLKECESLRVLPPATICPATQHVPLMIKIVQKLLDNGHAYKAADGCIYYRIDSFPDYGKLAHIDRDALETGASGRVKADEYTKDNPQDFALWKAWVEDDGDVWWDSPFGKGRPGWHIECSAMSMHYLGETIDIHTGGVDNIFPHHQNEIAQSEGVSGKQFVKYWVHCEHLLVENAKMAKSKGNFYRLQDLLDKGASPIAVRYVLLASHYRQQLNFTFDGLDAAKASIERLQNCIVALQQHKVGRSDGTSAELIGALHNGFEQAMDDDLNVSEALAALFDFVKEVNAKLAAGQCDTKDAALYLDALKQIDSVLGVMTFDAGSLDGGIQALVDKREAARKNKDFKESDRIRDELKAKGIVLEDTPAGIRWKRA